MQNKITTVELEQKRRKYNEAKDAIVMNLRELLNLLNNTSTEPLNGAERKVFLDKFSMIDHRLLDRLDVAAYEFFEAKERLIE